MRSAVLFLLALLTGVSFAQDRVTAVDVTTLADGDYVLTKKAGVVSVRPLTLIVPSSPSPNPNPTPNPGPLTPFQTEIQRLTKAAIAKGGTETTGAGISSVYYLASGALGKPPGPGSLDVAFAAEAVRMGTDAVLNKQGEAAAWKEFVDAVDGTTTTLRAKGDLKTAAQFIAYFRDVAKGMDAATGYSPTALGLVMQNPQSPKNIETAVALGIFGDIDWKKLFDLILMFLELWKKFNPAILLPMGAM